MQEQEPLAQADRLTENVETFHFLDPSPERSSRQPAPTQFANDVSEAVGGVPIVRLNRLGSLCQSHELQMKLESCNPAGSIKDKNAAFLVRAAERSGLLKPGGTIIESSSGNFGIGLAMIGAARGYRVMIVVDAKTPPPVRRMLKAYGAELVDIPTEQADEHGSMQVARMKKAADLAREIAGGWYSCQHLNPLNPEAHAEYTAREIEASFDPVPDAIVIGVSTAGQIAGLASYLKPRYPELDLVAVDVDGSAIFHTPRRPYKMTGLGLSFRPPAFDPLLVSEAYLINDPLAFSMCRQLACLEGLLLGASTGAIVCAGLAYARRHPRRRRILLINPDRGDRYLETVYNDDWIRQQGLILLAGDSLGGALEHLHPVAHSVLRGEP